MILNVLDSITERHFRKSIYSKDRSTRKEDFESIKKIKIIPSLSFAVAIGTFIWAVWSFIFNAKVDLVVKFIPLATNGSKSDNMAVFNTAHNFLLNNFQSFIRFMIIAVLLVLAIDIPMHYYYKLKKINYYRYFYIDTFNAKRVDNNNNILYNGNLPFKENP